MNGFTAPLVGLTFDRLGPRWVYGCGMLEPGRGVLSAGSLTALWQFYLFIGVLVGIGVSMNGMVPGSALLARWYRERLSTAIGVAYSAFGIGTVVFVPLVQYLVGEFDWRATYRIMGSALLLLAPVVIFALPWKTFAAGHPARAASRQKQRRGLDAARPRCARGCSGAWCRCSSSPPRRCSPSSCSWSRSSSTPASRRSRRRPRSAWSACCPASSVMASGLSSDRFGYRQTISLSFVGTATGMALLLATHLHPSVLLLVLFVPVFGLCMGMRGPIVSSVAARYFAGPRVATIYGLIYASNAVGAALGAFAGGLLHDLTGGYRAALAMSLMLIMVAALPFWTVPALRNFR